MIKWLVDTWSPKKPEENVSPIAARPQAIQQVPNTSRFEAQTFNSVNTYRANLGLQALTPIVQLNGIALSHTRAMLAINVPSHDGWNERGRQIQSLGFVDCGENVGGGECYPHEVQGMVNALVPGWINSPGHRQVIETSAFTYTGLALLIGQHPQKPDRTIWFATQVFGGR